LNAGAINHQMPDSFEFARQYWLRAATVQLTVLLGLNIQSV
jgi:hypothetical protein